MSKTVHEALDRAVAWVVLCCSVRRVLRRCELHRNILGKRIRLTILFFTKRNARLWYCGFKIYIRIPSRMPGDLVVIPSFFLHQPGNPQRWWIDTWRIMEAKRINVLFYYRGRQVANLVYWRVCLYTCIYIYTYIYIYIYIYIHIYNAIINMAFFCLCCLIFVLRTRMTFLIASLF